MLTSTGTFPCTFVFSNQTWLRPPTWARLPWEHQQRTILPGTCKYFQTAVFRIHLTAFKQWAFIEHAWKSLKNWYKIRRLSLVCPPTFFPPTLISIDWIYNTCIRGTQMARNSGTWGEMKNCQNLIIDSFYWNNIILSSIILLWYVYLCV